MKLVNFLQLLIVNLALLKSKKSDPDSIRQVCIEQKLNEKTVLNGEFLS